MVKATPQNDLTKMQAARVMIEEKRYDVARELLKGVANRQALDWLLKIDALIPRKRRHINWSMALALICILLCIIAALLVMIRERDNNLRVWQAQRFDAILILTSSCGGVYNDDYEAYEARSSQCRQWAQQLLDADASRAESIVKCMNLEQMMNTPTTDATATNNQLRACVGALGIANPNF